MHQLNLDLNDTRFSRLLDRGFTIEQMKKGFQELCGVSFDDLKIDTQNALRQKLNADFEFFRNRLPPFEKQLTLNFKQE